MRRLPASASPAGSWPTRSREEIGLSPIAPNDAGRDSALAALVEREAGAATYSIFPGADFPGGARMPDSRALYAQAPAADRGGLALPFHPEAEKEISQACFIGQRSRRFLSRRLEEIAA